MKEMKSTNDLSASQFRRKDLVGEACALVKVQLTAKEVGFEGNVIQPVEYKGGEYWVYMSKGSRELRIKHLAASPAFVPCHVSFSEYGFTGLESLATYDLTLLLPQSSSAVQKQKLTINYTPSNAFVLVDSKLYQGNGYIEEFFPVGSHNYQVVATGFVTAEGTVKLNPGAPSIISVNLVAENTSLVTQIVEEPIKAKDNKTNIVTEDQEIEGLSAREIGELAACYFKGDGGKQRVMTNF